MHLCLCYFIWQQFVSNGWAFQAPLDQYKYKTQLALWEKKKKGMVDRIQQGNRS